MHENPILPCRFGCSTRDCTAHYITCPKVWEAVERVMGSPSCDGLERRAFTTNPDTFKHAVQAQHTDTTTDVVARVIKASKAFIEGIQ